MTPLICGINLKDWIQRLNKCQYFSILAISVSLLSYEIFQCLRKYHLQETGTADMYVHLSKTNFPQMTVCPTNSYQLDKLKNFGIPTQSAIQYEAQWIANDSEVSPKQLFAEVTRPIEDVVFHGTFFVEQEFNGSHTIVHDPRDSLCNENLFQVKGYYYNGNCFSLKIPTCLQKAGILEIDLRFKQKVDVFIHHVGQFLSSNSR